MAVMLLLGSGGDDILWAFQSGTIGAVAAGMAALVVAPRRPAVAAILLDDRAGDLGRLARVPRRHGDPSAADPSARARLAGPAGRALSRLVRRFRRVADGRSRSPSLDGVPEYVLTGLAASAAGALGLVAPLVGQFVLLVLAFALGRARAVPPVVLALLVSSVAFFAIAGLVRAQLGAEQATAPRYVYIAVPGLLIAGAVLLARIRRRGGTVVGVPRSRSPLVGNTALLVATHDRLVSKIECERSMTPIARGAPATPAESLAARGRFAILHVDRVLSTRA